MFEATRKPVSIQDFKNDIKLVRLAQHSDVHTTSEAETRSCEEERSALEESTHPTA